MSVFTVEEDDEDARVGQFLSTQQVDVLHPEVEGQFDDGTILHVSSDVGHQGQVLHQTTGLVGGEHNTIQPFKG